MFSGGMNRRADEDHEPACQKPLLAQASRYSLTGEVFTRIPLSIIFWHQFGTSPNQNEKGVSRKPTNSLILLVCR